jgi:ferredoxin
VIHTDDEGYPILCIQCGSCARFCPQEVLWTEEVKDV